jgi:hypothetical protein
MNDLMHVSLKHIQMLMTFDKYNNLLGNQNDSLKNKKGMNDLMHVSLKHIQMLTTFDKYNNLLLSLYIYIYVLKYVMKDINLLFSNVYRCFDISLRGKVKRVTVHPPSRHAQTHPLTYLR